MANQNTNASAIMVNLVGNPTRTAKLHQAHMDALGSASRFGAQCAEWHQVLAVVTANPLLALKPVVEDLTVRHGLVAALAQGERWAAVDHADGKPALEALLEALAIQQPAREHQISIAVKAMEIADAASRPLRLAAYYAAATALLYAS